MNKERFTFRIPQKLMDKVREESKALGVSANALILNILWQWEKRISGSPEDNTREQKGA